MKRFFNITLLLCLLVTVVFGDLAMGQLLLRRNTTRSGLGVPSAGQNQRIPSRQPPRQVTQDVSSRQMQPSQPTSTYTPLGTNTGSFQGYRAPSSNTALRLFLEHVDIERINHPEDLTNAKWAEQDAAATLTEQLANTVVCTALTYRGGHAKVYADGDVSAENVPKNFIAWIKKFREDGNNIKSVAFTRNGGWVIIYGYNAYRYWNIPSGLVTRLKEAVTKQKELLSVAIGPRDEWVLHAPGPFWAKPTALGLIIEELSMTGQLLRGEFDTTGYKLWIKNDVNGNIQMRRINFR